MEFVNLRYLNLENCENIVTRVDLNCCITLKRIPHQFMEGFLINSWNEFKIFEFGKL